ncbi:MAG: hypothetical protein QG582_413 [Candidatus Thermoplasmatota archaeon]|nr:hypothetical protein [Candidatus Thermoplasmatota archaeon]
MAKKRKKEKENKEEYEYTPPEFDEREFLLKELKDTKTVLMTVMLGAFFGAVAGVLSGISESLVMIGFALMVGGAFSLKYIYPLIKVDTSTFQRKNWAGNVFWFVMTSLAIWVLVLNFPFADHADPSVTEVTVWVSNGTNQTAIDYVYIDSAGSYIWVPRWGEELSTMVHSSATYTINITAKVADNGELTTVRISVNSGDAATMSPEGSHRFGYSLTGDQILSSGLTFTITATDGAGHVKTFAPAGSIPVSA